MTKPSLKPKPVETYHQKLKSEKRSAAMQAAMALFLEQGYERTSLQQIAKRAGLSTSTLFTHFPTKTALFEAIVEEYWELDDQYKYLPEAGNPRAGLKKIADDYACLLSRPGMASLFRVVIAEVPQLPELGKTQFNSGQLPFIESLQVYLRAEIKAGTLSIQDVPLAAKQFLGMIAGNLFWPGLLLLDFAPSDKESSSAVKEAIQMMIARYGVEAKNGRK